MPVVGACLGATGLEKQMSIQTQIFAYIIAASSAYRKLLGCFAGIIIYVSEFCDSCLF
jgi:hypothetical protein